MVAANSANPAVHNDSKASVAVAAVAGAAWAVVVAAPEVVVAAGEDRRTRQPGELWLALAEDAKPVDGGAFFLPDRLQLPSVEPHGTFDALAEESKKVWCQFEPSDNSPQDLRNCSSLRSSK